ncbi:MAG: polysaccharide deacetylase family protein [Abitibacteriaceae bacterium]|nr:polysaccharide deacetylase family protein [Abditibacteriaceae bacterium]MBV9864985.1 polysaccharide deacetylase family protein [Abditibacteriaceae bacterium]
MTSQSFSWPSGKTAAISLSLDDARSSQLEHGLPLLNQYGVKATFYVNIGPLEKRADDWRGAVQQGHEIGNHTLHHPCSGNFRFSRSRALEDYSLERMEDELLGANQAIENLVGVRPTTFAYPCGQKFVGRGENVKSYVPLVARNFIVGRGFREEAPNDPTFCDLAQACGVDTDELTWEALKVWIERAVESGGWLILAGHDVGAAARQTVREDTLEALCRHVIDPAHGLWLDTVATIGTYIRNQNDGHNDLL